MEYSRAGVPNHIADQTGKHSAGPKYDTSRVRDGRAGSFESAGAMRSLSLASCRSQSTHCPLFRVLCPRRLRALGVGSCFFPAPVFGYCKQARFETCQLLGFLAKSAVCDQRDQRAGGASEKLRGGYMYSDGFG